MAETAHTITAPISVASLTIKITTPRPYRIRMWVMSQLIRLAGWVGPHDITVEIVGKAKV